LVVDDQLENRLLLAQLLEKVGFIVQLAEDGAEAVARFQSWRPRFVWMDQRMPVMDGAEATRRIRVLPGGEKVKIVAVTASVFEQEDTTLLQAGFDAIVHKPYLSEQIYDIMASLLGVRYIYASPEASAPLPSELSSQALAALPVSLRHAFAEALTTLDVERIETLVAEISAIDAALAASINPLVENYNYQPIVNALDDLPLAPPLGIEADEISG
jgi:CheY-like chemotaxis protein